MNIKNIQKILDDKWFDKKVTHNEHFVQWAVISKLGVIIHQDTVDNMQGSFKSLYLWFDSEVSDIALQRIFNHYDAFCRNAKVVGSNHEALDRGQIYHIGAFKVLVLS